MPPVRSSYRDHPGTSGSTAAVRPPTGSVGPTFAPPYARPQPGPHRLGVDVNGCKSAAPAGVPLVLTPASMASPSSSSTSDASPSGCKEDGVGGGGGGKASGGSRVRNACEQCRKRRARCSRTYPCMGCISHGDNEACNWEGGFPAGNIGFADLKAQANRDQMTELSSRISRLHDLLGSLVTSKPAYSLTDHPDWPFPPRFPTETTSTKSPYEAPYPARVRKPTPLPAQSYSAPRSAPSTSDSSWPSSVSPASTLTDRIGMVSHAHTTRGYGSGSSSMPTSPGHASPSSSAHLPPSPPRPLHPAAHNTPGSAPYDWAMSGGAQPFEWADVSSLQSEATGLGWSAPPPVSQAAAIAAYPPHGLTTTSPWASDFVPAPLVAYPGAAVQELPNPQPTYPWGPTPTQTYQLVDAVSASMAPSGANGHMHDPRFSTLAAVGGLGHPNPVTAHTEATMWYDYAV